MCNNEEKRSRLIDMAWLLNDMVVDLRTPVDLIIHFKPDMKDSKQNFMSISRLCLQSIIINLCKINEIIDHYGADIRDFPDPIKNPLYKIKSEVEKRGMYSFRSKYLAHSFSKEKGEERKPLSFDQNVKALMNIIDYGLNPVTENIFRFCDWIYIKDDASSVIYVIYETVKHIESTVGGLGQRR